MRPALPLALGAAIAGRLAEFGCALRLKWPNDLQRDGRKAGGLLVEARRAGPTERALKWARRRPAVAALCGLVALLAATGFGNILWQWRHAVEDRRLADRQAREVTGALALAESALYFDRITLADFRWAHGAADRAEVQVAYAIGVARPVSLLVETFGTEKVDIDQITKAVDEIFDLRPAAIMRDLDLRRPIYAQTAAYGHFGRDGLPWEELSRVDAVKSALGL